MEARGPGTSAGRHRGRAAAVGAAIGLVVGGVAVGTAQLVAGIVNPAASPILTVGQSAIDAAPGWLKDAAIRTFGPSDKSVLLAGIGVVLALAAIALGIASLRRLWVGVAGLLAFGAIGVVAALTRPVARPGDALPAIAATAAGLLTLVALRSCVRSDATAAATGADDGEAPWVIDRRRFLLTATAGVVGAVAAGGAGNFFARRFRADASRAAVGIPTPASRAAAIDGAELHVPGLGPFLTPNERFYRVDTALFAPAVTAEDWSLRIHGMVRRRDHAGLRTTPVASAHRARHHAHLRLEPRRWPVRRQRALDRRAAARPARGGGAAARRGPDRGPLGRRVHRRDADGGRDGRPRRDARGRDERRAAPHRPRLPRPDDRARPVRVRLRDQVDRRPRAHDVRRLRPVLGRSAAGPSERRSRRCRGSIRRRRTGSSAPARSRSPASRGRSTWGSTGSRSRSTTVRGCRRSSPRRTPSIRGGSGCTDGRRHAASTSCGFGRSIGTGAPQTPVRTDPFPDGATGYHTIAVVVR